MWAQSGGIIDTLTVVVLEGVLVLHPDSVVVGVELLAGNPASPPIEVSLVSSGRVYVDVVHRRHGSTSRYNNVQSVHCDRLANEVLGFLIHEAALDIVLVDMDKGCDPSQGVGVSIK